MASGLSAATLTAGVETAGVDGRVRGSWVRCPEPSGQYVSSDGAEVVVLAWAPDRHYGLGHGESPLRLAGLDQLSRYRDTDSGLSIRDRSC
jgi:hypothetical protein